MTLTARVQLAGLGVALPRTSVAQAELAEAAVGCCCNDERQARLLRNLYRRSGVERRGCAILDAADEQSGSKSRDIAEVFPPVGGRGDNGRGPTLAARMALYVAAAYPLARRAASEALERSGLPAGDVAHLVTVSCTGFAAPGVDAHLIEALRLPRDVSRTHVGFMGCHAALNGWAVADALAARTGRPALLVCVEVCTAHFAYGWRPDRMVANALFADGAAAAVLVPNSSTNGPAMLDRFSCLLPGSAGAMTWQLGDHGFEMTLAPEVPGLIRQHAGPALLPWLAQHGLTPNELTGVVIHPGGPRVLRSTTEALGLPPEAADISRELLRQHGNLSSPTVLVALRDLLATQHTTHARNTTAPPTPAHHLLIAFGPGLAIEAMLLGDDASVAR